MRKSTKSVRRKRVLQAELPSESFSAPRDWSTWERRAQAQMKRAKIKAGLA